MTYSISLLEKESSDYSNILNTFRVVTKNPLYNPFKFDYKDSEKMVFTELKTIYHEVCSLLQKNKLPLTRLIGLIADGNQDGHALYLKDEVITFIDFKAYLSHLERNNFDNFSHLLHEMLHGAHYSINRKLSPSNLIAEEDILLAKSFVEGVAVFLAQKLHESGDNYWFGYLNDETKQKWIEHSENNYENDLSALSTGQYSEEQKINLLSLKSFSEEDIFKGRRAYYVVSKFLNGKNILIEDILRFSLVDFQNLITN